MSETHDAVPGLDVDSTSRWHKEAKVLATQMRSEVLSLQQGHVFLAHQMSIKGGRVLLMTTVVPPELLGSGCWIHPKSLVGQPELFMYGELSIQAVLERAPPDGIFSHDLWSKTQQRGVHVTATSGAFLVRFMQPSLAQTDQRPLRSKAEVEETSAWVDGQQVELEQQLRQQGLVAWADKVHPVPRESIMVDALRRPLELDDKRFMLVFHATTRLSSRGSSLLQASSRRS